MTSDNRDVPVAPVTETTPQPPGLVCLSREMHEDSVRYRAMEIAQEVLEKWFGGEFVMVLPRKIHLHGLTSFDLHSPMLVWGGAYVERMGVRTDSGVQYATIVFTDDQAFAWRIDTDTGQIQQL